MKVAVIGSRDIVIENFEEYIDFKIDEIVTGGARGVDKSAIAYANANKIKTTVFLPDYQAYKKGAPFKRNKQIAEYSDMCLAFWNGKSKGTKQTILCFEKLNKPVIIKILKAR